VIKNMPASSGDMGDVVLTLGQEDPLEKEMAILYYFLVGNIPLYICTTYLCIPVNDHLCCSHVLAIVNSDAVNIGVYVSF